MKRIIRRIGFLCALLLLLGALVSCAGIDLSAFLPKIGGDPAGEEHPGTEGSDSGSFRVTFTHDGNNVGNQTFKAGTRLNAPDFDLPDDERAEYEFYGWDADGDGKPEKFPYTVNADVDFVSLYDETLKIYHYDIYVGGVRVSSVDAHYGDTVEYPPASSYFEGETPHLFDGWSYDGEYDGKTVLKVTRPMRIDAHYAETQILTVYFDGKIQASVQPEGTPLSVISALNVSPGANNEIRWYTDRECTKKNTRTAMPEGNLTLYGREEKSVYTSVDVATQADLQKRFDLLLLNRESGGEYHTLFPVTDLNALLSDLTANAPSSYSFHVNASCRGSELTIGLTYDPVNIKTSSAIYTKQKLFPESEAASGRAASFDDFPMNDRSKTLPVVTSEALVYALERGYKPVPAKDSAAEALLEEMKSVLRGICDDSMTDLEKAKKIYEYLVTEVTYDGLLLDKVMAGEPNLSEYRAFYLEGVFFDKLAVCDGISKAFLCLCNIEGIGCVQVSGDSHDGVAHAWNRVCIDGKWYIVDATTGSPVMGDRQSVTYAYFLLTDEEYTFATPGADQTFAEPCNTEYHYYVETKLTVGGKEYALEVNGRADAGALVRYFYANAGENRCFEISLGYAFTDESEEVREILKTADLNRAVSYSANGKVLRFFS